MNYKVTSQVKILVRQNNNVVLSWQHIYEFPNGTANVIYILQINDKLNGWRTVYWGPRTQKNVDDLTPCTCYVFRLRFKTDKFLADWITFKAATDYGPFLVMHMTRAANFAITSNIRKLVSQRPALLEIENKELKTPLIQVIEKGNIQMVQFLLNMGANPNKSTLIGGRTPIMIALFRGYIQIASLLIDKGASLIAVDVNKMAPVHYAVDSNNIDSIKFCVSQGCNVNVQDNKGWSPLLRAVVLECDSEIIRHLLEKGADVKKTDKCGFNFYKHCRISNKNYTEFCKSSESL